MTINYATDIRCAPVAWPMRRNKIGTQGLIVGGVGAGKSTTLRLLAERAKENQIQVWSHCPMGLDLGGKNMSRSKWNRAVRSYRGKEPVLAILDEPGTNTPEPVPTNPRVTVVVATPAPSEKVQQNIDVLLDLGSMRDYGGGRWGWMRTPDPGGQLWREVNVDTPTQTPGHR